MIKNTKRLAAIVISVAALVIMTLTTVYATAGNDVTSEKSASFSYVLRLLKIQSDKLILGVGEEYSFDLAINGEYDPSLLKWSSSNSSVLTVDEYGKVAARKAGSAAVSVKLLNGESASCNIKVTNAPTAISVSREKATRGVGDCYQFSASITPSNAVSKCTWSSSDSAVVSVDANGRITPKKAGVANITVKTYNGKSASCKVTVRNAPSSVTLSREKATRGVGDSYQLSASIPSGTMATYVWVSSNPWVASVNQSGKITPKKVGTAEITVRTYNGKSASCKVTVKKAPDSVALNKTSATKGVGDTLKLTSKIPSGTMTNYTYSSSNKSVASVNKNGLVTPKKAGTATITVKTHNGKKASCKITVKNAPTSVKLNRTSATRGVGDCYRLTRTLSSNSASTDEWSSSNSSVVSVDKNGKITPKKVGTAKITVETYNGKKASCTVKVKKAPTSIKLETPKALDTGKSCTIKKTLSANSMASCTWSSSNKNIASVDKNGKVTAKNSGSAKITVKTYNGKTASCTVNVNEGYTDDDLYCLAAVIWQEAGSSWISDRLQLMVANVVMNHVASPSFPNTIRGVLTRPYAYGRMAWDGIHMPTASDPITKAAIDRCYANAKKILDGYRLLPSNVIYQAGFVQGSGVYTYENGIYFCYA